MTDARSAGASLDAVLRIPPSFQATPPPVRFEPFDCAAGGGCPKYVIAMTARTGSTALCRYIAATGRLGDPREFLNPTGFMAKLVKNAGVATIGELLAIARSRTTDGNGCFGLTTNFWSLYPFIAGDLFHGVFGKSAFVYLRRRDLLAQAISLYIAQTSRQWHRFADGRIIGESEARPVAFDYDAIAAQVKILAHEDANWRSLFAATGIEPLQLDYEDFADAMPAAVRRIAAHLGVELPSVPEPEDGFVRVASPLNAEFHRRFRVACGQGR